jgi:sporulation protein YlmC with PRC-barrel domain
LKPPAQLEEETTVFRSHTAAAALATLLVATAPVAYAETAPHSRTVAATGGETMIQPDQIRASKMIGSAVYDVQNRKIGHVKDLVLDREGQVASVIVDVGAFLGMGGKYVAVNLRDLKTDHNRLTLDLTKEQLQQAQNYRLENPNTGAGTSTSPVHGGHLGSGR